MATSSDLAVSLLAELDKEVSDPIRERSRTMADSKRKVHGPVHPETFALWLKIGLVNERGEINWEWFKREESQDAE